MSKEVQAAGNLQREVKQYMVPFGDREVVIETGKLAPQASGAVTVRDGDTVVFVSVVMNRKVRDDIDYFPLFVDFEEKLYAAGKIKGSRFIKREGRPSDDVIIVSRVIDRCLRPNFPKGMVNEVQIIATVQSYDGVHDPSVLAVMGASAALSISDIPFGKPVAGMRVGMFDGEIVVNPSLERAAESQLDLMVAGNGEVINMLESGSSQISEEQFMAAVERAHEEIGKTTAAMAKMVAEIGQEKQIFASPEMNPDVIADVTDRAKAEVSQILFESGKRERADALESLREEIVTELVEKYGEEAKKEIGDAYHELTNQVVRENILKEGRRVGGRGITEVRPLYSEVGLLPRAHGSGLFQRGETQVLTVATLGAPGDEQTVDGLVEFKKRYMHHYNFPAYSVGETGPMRGPGRREIGHGMLAERALMPVIPADKEKFPYTLRVVSEIMASNGSSSMGSVCGSTLALMDAGVPITAPVSGIAMGLMTDKESGEYKVLSDIQDIEDFGGDMDFKVAGTEQGITAVQMDVKLEGITPDLVRATIEQAKEGRLHILKTMLDALPAPREEMSPYAPRITSLKIDPEKIGLIIGPGGKMINEIIDETGVDIDIEDDGLVMISSVDQEGAKKAIEWVKSLVAEPEVGKIYDGKVVKVMDFGAFVEFMPGKDGLVHISQLADHRVERVEDVVKQGDMVKVKLLEVDSQGRNNLSMKAAMPGAKPDAPREERRGGDRGDRPPRPRRDDRPRR